MIVMAGLVPAIHALVALRRKKDMDTRHKAGMTEYETTPLSLA
jgi:hypothetical protein